jgi:hypothetical protein
MWYLLLGGGTKGWSNLSRVFLTSIPRHGPAEASMPPPLPVLPPAWRRCPPAAGR